MIHGKKSKGYRYRNIKVVIQSEGGTQKRDSRKKEKERPRFASQSAPAGVGQDACGSIPGKSSTVHPDIVGINLLSPAEESGLFEVVECHGCINRACFLWGRDATSLRA